MPPHTADTMRASSSGSKSSSDTATVAPDRLSRTGPSPKLVIGSLMPTRLAMATPFQRPSPWWSRS